MAISDISTLVDKVKASSPTLTCSEVADLLMDQPAPGDSHAHMHATDGFIRDEGLIKDASTVARKQVEWGYDSHLFPGATQPLQDVSASSEIEKRERVLQDYSRIAPDNSYNLRTNLPRIPGSPGIDTFSYSVREIIPPLAPGAKGSQQNHTFSSAAEAMNFASTHPSKKFVPAKPGPGPQVFRTLISSVPPVPEVGRTYSHSMWDSESMVMHLTALLLSPTGREALALLNDSSRGSDKSIGVFSKTAVRAVAAHVLSLGKPQPQVEERTADTRADRTVTGTFSKSSSPIDHVVASFYRSPTGKLIVNTFYPTARDTVASCGIRTTADEEVLETEFGRVHLVKPVSTIPIKLQWNTPEPLSTVAYYKLLSIGRGISSMVSDFLTYHGG